MKPISPVVYRLLITGSRTWDNYLRLATYLNRERRLSAEAGLYLVVVHGACPKGADALTDRWCLSYNVGCERWPANWQINGKTAGFIRNQQMVDSRPDRFLAFLRDNSAGTRHAIERAGLAGISGEVVNY